MEYEEKPKTVLLDGHIFSIVKGSRLNPGMVLYDPTRDIYARLGPKELSLEEQIHTISLHERGFPVPQVLSSGQYGNDEWFFTEESLGEDNFHDQFAKEWTCEGKISDETHQNYLSVLERYATAQVSEKNRTTISAAEFVEALIPDELIKANYIALGRDFDRLKQALSQATIAISDAPMGVLQYDFNPCNVLDNGLIDFEMVGYGPIGYDGLLSARWHRWFCDYESRFTLAYRLSEAQVAASDALIDSTCIKNGLAKPSNFLEEFSLLKTAWGFSSNKLLEDEESSKLLFYNYRAELLSRSVDSYLAGKLIDTEKFPHVHADSKYLPS